MYEAANDSIFDTVALQVQKLAREEQQQAQQAAFAHGYCNGLGNRGVASTRGHCAGNGGLRGHSVGGTFPCVLFSMGNPHVPQGLSYWFKSPDSQDHGPYTTWDESEQAALSWLNNRPVSFEPQVEV